MKPFPPLVFFGSDDFSAGVLERLLSHQDFKSSLKYVVTKTPRTLGRGRKTVPTIVEETAKNHSDASIVYANSRADLDAAMQKLELQKDAPMGVLVSYGVLVSDYVLGLFPHGIINLHPSLLPAYRGPSPVETAMLHGDSELGVSVMKLIKEMDAGPVYTTYTVALNGDESRDDVYTKIIASSGDRFYDALKGIADGSLSPVEQDHEKATYTELIKKEDGVLRSDGKTAEQLEREVRTFLGFPKSRATILGHDVVVTKAHVVSAKDAAPLVIPCDDHTFLAIDTLIAPSGRSMSGDAFLRGYSNTKPR